MNKYRRTLFQTRKLYLGQIHCQHYPEKRNTEAFNLKSGTIQGDPFSPLLFSTVFTTLGSDQTREKNENDSNREGPNHTLSIDTWPDPYHIRLQNFHKVTTGIQQIGISKYSK